MIDRKTAIDNLIENNYSGWIKLVHIIYDNLPANVIITEVFQKWAGLEIRYNGGTVEFDKLVISVRSTSEQTCEVCGNIGVYSILDGWETTLCLKHYNESPATKRYRKTDQ